MAEPSRDEKKNRQPLFVAAGLVSRDVNLLVHDIS